MKHEINAKAGGNIEEIGDESPDFSVPEHEHR
jgi:hypothetical protein